MATCRSWSQNIWNWQGIWRNRKSRVIIVLLLGGGAAGLYGQSPPVTRAHQEIPLSEIVDGRFLVPFW